MKKFNLLKGISASFVALALVTGLAMPANAAKVTKDVNQVGAVSAPAIALKDSTASSQTTDSWTFTYSPVPASYVEKDADGEITFEWNYSMKVLVFDKGDRTEPVAGSYYTDDLGKKVVNSSYVTKYYVDPVENPTYKYEFTIDASDLTSGEKEVVAYVLDGVAYRDAAKAKYDEAMKAYEAACDACDKAYEEWVAAGRQGDAPEYPDRPDNPISSWSGSVYEDDANELGISKADYYVASAPVAITVTDEAYVNTIVSATSIKFDMSAASATGFEIYRKADKKYVKIAKVASRVYTDNGLESAKKYSYKVRPYYVNETTGKTVYGKYTLVEATTRGSALNAKATITNKNKVKLSWSKVKGATKYEIYRKETDSAKSVVSKGNGNGYDSYKLVATVKKSKKNWTDKNVSANCGYSYYIKAIIGKNSKVKGDKGAMVEAYVYADLAFGTPYPETRITDSKGNVTITWDRVYGAKGYIVEERVWDSVNKEYNWVEIKRLSKSKTKVKLEAKYQYRTNEKNESYISSGYTEYRIKAYKGKDNNVYSDTYEISTTLSLGAVKKVTAKKTTNGIQVSWTPVEGAAYYKVFRVQNCADVNYKDASGYYTYGNTVTEYVDAAPAKTVDVAAWNAAVDADIAAYKAAYKAYNEAMSKWDGQESTKPVEPKYDDYLNEGDKLNDKLSYFYQNYSYSRNIFDANTTSIVDFCGKVYSGEGSRAPKNVTINADKKASATEFDYYYDPVVQEDNGYYTGLQAGVSYKYYVVAYAADAKPMTDYSYEIFDQAGYDAAVDKYYEDQQKYYNDELDEYPVYPDWDDYYYECTSEYAYAQNTTVLAYNTASVGGPKATDMVKSTVTVLEANDYIGYGKDAGETYASTSTVTKTNAASFTTEKTLTKKQKPTIKSIKSSKKTVTLKLKKKVKGADGYKIYRATKKKGTYTCVGMTTKTSFKDSGLTKGKKYYYKVVPYVLNEAGVPVEGKASAVKNVTVK